MATKRAHDESVRRGGPELVLEEAGAGFSALPPTLIQPPRPSGCRRYVRARLAEALPAIADALVGKAAKGGLDELKMLLQISGLNGKDLPPVKKMQSGKALADELMAEWRREPADGFYE